MTYPGYKKSSSRYQLIMVFWAVALAAFAILRSMLLVDSWGEIDHSLAHLVRIFVSGFIYDIGFLSYFSLFFALVFLVLPRWLFSSRIFGWFAHAVFFTLTSGLMCLLVAEWLFWEEFNVRFNFIAVDYLIYRQEVTDNIYQSYPVIWLLSGMLLASFILWLGVRKRLASALASRDSFGQRLGFFCLSAILAAMSYFWIDDSLRSASDNNYINELASNGAYQFVSAFRHNSLEYRTLYALGDDNKLSGMLKQQVKKDDGEGGLYDISRQVTAMEKPIRPNVILLCVESLSAEYLTRFGNKGKNITPFMDEWFKQGLLFTRCYATGTRTTRGLEAITISVPPTPGRSLVKRPERYPMYTLGKVFQDNGYDTAFVYGGRGYFDNMNAFFSDNGYTVVDKADFSDDEKHFENAWGVSDEDLFAQVIKQARLSQEKGKPFFFHVMTTSNHRPYTYPEGKIDIPSGTHRNGAVKYTDYAIGQLIRNARKEPWFDSTLFVVVADHCASSAGKIGLPINKYHIPLFIYGPAYVLPAEIDRVCSQIDIAPTVLGLAGLSYTSWFFGHDVLDRSYEPRALIGNYQKLALFQDNILTILSPNRQVHQIRDPENNRDTIDAIDPNEPLGQKTIMYYQGADYIISHRINQRK
ncbi:MAG: sulfatase-like hydrolase/transferase [Pseudomonadota bacterium]